MLRNFCPTERNILILSLLSAFFIKVFSSHVSIPLQYKFIQLPNSGFVKIEDFSGILQKSVAFTNTLKKCKRKHKSCNFQ